MSRIWKTCLFLVFLGGGEGGKIFWGLPNRFSTNPERIVKVRESAPSKIGLLCIGDVHWMMLLLMIAWWSLVTFTIFQFFSKKHFWQCWETYCCEFQIKKPEVVLSKVREFAFVVGWSLDDCLMIAWWLFVTFTIFHF